MSPKKLLSTELSTKAYFFLASILLLMVFLAQAEAQAQTPPPGTRIVSVSAIGNGCPSGTVSSTLSPDNQELSLLFDQFISESGGNLNIRADKKVCVIEIGFQIPAGYSMGLVSADYRGFAAVEPGAQGQHEVLYSFNKSYAGSSFSSRVLRGPLNENYLIHNELDPRLVNWSPCNQAQVSLTVRTSLVTQAMTSIAGRLPSAMITLDSVDAAVRQSFRIAWRTCSAPGPVPNPGPRPPVPNPGPGPGPVVPRPPAPPPVNNQTINIYQLWDGRDRFLTTDPRLAERGSWVNQGVAFQLYRQPNQLRFAMPLYSCLDDGQNLHFVSADARCEGRRNVGLLGYMSSQPEPRLAGLMQYVQPGNPSVRLTTTSQAEGAQSGLAYDRVIGFVIQTRP
jgi:hypothetical protein